MKKLFSLFFIFFSYYAAFAQNTKQTEIIDKKLKKILQHINDHPKSQENQLFQLKAESEKLNYDLGILQSGNLLMKLYGLQNKNKETIKLGEELKKMARNKKDKYGYISNIYRKNALALGYLGLATASMKDFKTAIKYAQTIENKDKRSYYLSLCYQNINIYYLNKRFENKKNMDTVLSNLNKSLEEVNRIKDNNGTVSNDLKYDQISFIDMRLGIYYLEQADTKENIESAEKYLLEGLKIHENKKYAIPVDNRIMMLNQVSWLYLEKKEYQKSIDYAQHALELEKQFRDPSHRVESFEFLADAYREINKKDQSGFYLDKYIYLKDSLNYMERNEADTSMKKMVAEVDHEYKENSKKQWIITGIIILISAITIIFFWRRKNRIIHKKYEDLIARINKEKEDRETEPVLQVNVKANEVKSSVSITDETLKTILLKLERFETSEKYLRKDLSLTWMAHHLNTNTKYLSEIIKVHRDHNFTSYINDLRINYIIKKLYESPIYREYKITYLAEECGYTTPRVFVNAFRKETGFTPSYFVEQLKNSA